VGGFYIETGAIMELTPQSVTDYMTGLLPPRHKNFYDMEEYAKGRKFPIVGPLVGNFLAQEAAGIGVKRIMELGSGFGYSALWFSTVLPDDGKIICTDDFDENVKRAETMFAAHGKSHLLDFRRGDALEVFESTDGEFDFIFCDIGKKDYPRAFDMALPRVRKGGILAFDNCLWSGRMLEGDDGDATKGVVELNKKAFASAECRTTIVPIRDGVLLCRKL
jgi:predicted O-methyltransferase YrrM